MFAIKRAFSSEAKALALCLFALSILFSASCGFFGGHAHDEAGGHSESSDHGHDESGGHAEEAIARTEFTDRLLNFFEFAPLHVGKTSQFLIHLTDLQDGTPVEKAEVKLLLRRPDGESVGEVVAKVGRVTGIYVADVQFEMAGTYDIEFQVKNEKLADRMQLKNFTVE